MKRSFYLAPLAAMALASCADNDFIGSEEAQHVVNGDKAIAFQSATKALTRAADHVGADAADLLNNNFVVEGVKGDGTTKTVVFDHYNVNWKVNSAGTTASNTEDWEYVGETKNTLSGASAQTIKYWDFSTTQYDFVAVSLGKGVAASTAGDPNTVATLSAIDCSKLGTDNAVYTLTGSANELASAYIADLVTVYNRDGVSDYAKTVTPKFRSLGTKVRIAIYETVPGYSVKDVKFYSEAWDKTTATSEAGATDATLFTSSAFFPSATSKGTMSVSFPTVGYSKRTDADYNQAHIKFTAGGETGDALVKTKTFGAMDYKTTKEDSEANGSSFLGRTSKTATYAGDAANNYYQVVLPLGNSENLQLRVEYDLVPIDGAAEVIHVRDACAVVPAKYADWKPNYAYTYIFKISDATNGWTGTMPNPDYDPEDPDSPATIVVEGLTPITFDAVVVDTEDGIQETITTVSTPSITTYMKEAPNATANDEYPAGTIYVMVQNGASTLSLTGNGQLYTVTGATATVPATEANVMDALNMGTTSGDVTTGRNGLTLTTATSNAAITAIPGVDGNDITVAAGNAASFTGAAGTTYAYVYTISTGTSSEYYSAITIAKDADAKGYYTLSVDASGNKVYTEVTEETLVEEEAGKIYYQKLTTNNNVYAVKVIKVQ